MAIPTTTPLGTRVRWGGGAAPVGRGRTCQPVRNGRVDVERADGTGLWVADADIKELDIDMTRDDINDLLRHPYEQWLAWQGLEAGSTEEVLARPDLTYEQRNWLVAFDKLWACTEDMDERICYLCGEVCTGGWEPTPDHEEITCLRCIAKYRALADEGVAASMDAHGEMLPAEDVYSFLTINEDSEQYAEHMPDWFRDHYNAQR